MEWISTKNMTNEQAPEGEVLVQYLEPSWGGWDVEFAIGYFDNPNDYEDNKGEGWKHWTTEKRINVIAYAKLPETLPNPFEGKTQKDIFLEFGSYIPNLGNVGVQLQRKKIAIVGCKMHKPISFQKKNKQCEYSNLQTTPNLLYILLGVGVLKTKK